MCLMLSVCSADADGSERGGGHQQADGGVRVSVLQGPPVVHRGGAEGRAHRPLQDPQLPRRAEEQKGTRQCISTILYLLTTASFNTIHFILSLNIKTTVEGGE